jgi:prepilin-type N-terminal cleavage/methylation domain-containing protein
MSDRQGVSAGARRPARRDGSRGFTVIELLVVLVMVGVIAVMAVPRIHYERYRADAAMRGVRSSLLGAQRSAIMRQTNVVVGFDEALRLLVILEDTNNNCTADPGERLTTRPLEEGTRFAPPPSPFGAPVAGAVSGSRLCVMRGLPAIQFLRDGAASTDLDAYLTSGRGGTTDFRLVRVTPATGRSDTYRFDGSTWRRFN